MSYGTGPYGILSYGGDDDDGTGPFIAYASPTPDETGTTPDVPVVVTLQSSTGLNRLSLNLWLNGAMVVVGGSFLEPYSGTIVEDALTLTVTVAAHPDFIGGTSITVMATVRDVANAFGSFSWLFNVGFADIDALEAVLVSESETIAHSMLSRVSETVPVSDSVAPCAATVVLAPEAVPLATTLGVPENDLYLEESVPVTEAVALRQSGWVGLSEALPVLDSVSARSFMAKAVSGTVLRVDFLVDVRLQEAIVPTHYVLEPLDRGIFLAARNIEPIWTTVQAGSRLRPVAQGSLGTSVLIVGDGVFSESDLGRYLHFDGLFFQITSVSGNTCTVAGQVPTLPNWDRAWSVTTAVQGVLLTTDKMTNGAWYRIRVSGLRECVSGSVMRDMAHFLAESNPPRVMGATANPDGVVLVEFDSAMRMDEDITDPAQYALSGMRVTHVTTPDTRHVALHTIGMSDGSYALTVNASGTPKDEAGNPIDPAFSQAIFTGSVPLNVRSIFTDHGPIAKPPENLQSGTGAVVLNETDVVLPGAMLLPSHVGLYVVLSGSALNSGCFRISARLGATRARLKACLDASDPVDGSLDWVLQDPRNGAIADDPSDVVVRVNGLSVTPDAVVGLLGQVVLPTAPGQADDVQIDYCWCQSPTVEVHRLNSSEFRLNCWNRDLGVHSNTQHRYRFNTVLVTPAEYAFGDAQAPLDQPLLRELHYRAYERAYTAALNDPSLLTLNAPIHRIAYAPMSRETTGSFVRYEAATLPEDDPVHPWTRRGAGVAVVGGGILTVIDDSSGAYPVGQPIFWTHDVDLTFPAAFAMSWRGYVSSATEPDGVFVGVAAGHHDGERLVMVGCLLVGGVRKIGLLVHGSLASADAWAGGLDATDNPTGSPVEHDWSTQHSYRTHRGADGAVRVFVDGSVVESLRLPHDGLPRLEELDSPFDNLQGVFFGALSRPARSESKWDFFRYIVLPLSPYQVAPASFVNYEGDVLPEVAAAPWAPVGLHGTETLLPNDTLLLDSTSASSVTDVGFVGGDFRGFARIEPLLPAASEVLLDLGVQVITHTHGIAPNAVMAAVDDGRRLLQLCFFPDLAMPKVSYGGRTLPTDAPWNWASVGGAAVAMSGQALRITDDTPLDGRVFYVTDTAPAGPTRIVSGASNWVAECRFAVMSWTAESGADPRFAGAMFQVYDDTRLVGVMVCVVADMPVLALHSDGTVVTTVAFNWDDAAPHTYRLIKNTDTVSLFVDGAYVTAVAYSLFHAPAAPDPVGVVSFGSATPASLAAMSVVDWAYANAWRTGIDFRRYVGIWKGSHPSSLVGYHLPLKAAGKGASVLGNALGDASASFLAAGVASGDMLVIDSGPNAGVYTIAGVSGPTALVIDGVFPATPTETAYRIPAQVDWSVAHRYRLIRSPLGDISLLLDSDTTPLIALNYGVEDLPSSDAGIVRALTAGMSGIVWGAFDPGNLSQVAWGHIRYGLSRSPTELRIAPHHHLQYQWNIMASPEHLKTLVPHDHTGYLSCSTGIPPHLCPDVFDDPALLAFTQLNDGTPLVPLTQSWEVRRPVPVEVPIAGLNRIEDVLTTDPDFVLNDSRTRVEIMVPDDVLYTSLTVTEQQTGEPDLLKPLDDCPVSLDGLQYVKQVCLGYDASELPENDVSALTPWTRQDTGLPSTAYATVAAGVLTYGTGSGGARTVYRNQTPLTGAPGLEVEASYRIRIAQDTTWGLGDTCMRVGLSGLGYAVGLAFITSSPGERVVLAYDTRNGKVLGAIPFDYYDGAFHTYKIIRDIKHNTVRIEVVA